MADFLFPYVCDVTTQQQQQQYGNCACSVLLRQLFMLLTPFFFSLLHPFSSKSSATDFHINSFLYNANGAFLPKGNFGLTVKIIFASAARMKKKVSSI